VESCHSVRIDLRQLAPRADVEGKDFREILALWEKLAVKEPYFHITRSTDDAVPTNAKLIKDEKDPEGSVRFEHDGQHYFKSPNGNAYIHKNGEWQATKLQFSKKEAVAVAAAHVGLDTHVMLQGLTHSAVPVVRADWWIIKSLTTLDGGIYYDLVGIERKPAQGTARDAFFKKVGVDVKEIERLRSDQRTAMFKSKVTGRPRRIEYLQGISVRPDSGSGLVIITYDPSDAQVEAKNDPIRNLLDLEFAAQEIIAERPNGMHLYALFAANGDLQDSAPDNVVKDHNIPAPYTARLQSGISCIRCHNPFDGWIPASNDVKKLLAGYLDVFDDLSDKKGHVPDVLDRLAGLYAGDLAKPLRRGRDDYADAIFLATGGESPSQIGAQLTNTFVNYLYTDMDAAIAARELGYDLPPDKAALFMNVILPPLQKDVIGISPEDPILGALKINMKVGRHQWEQVYADAAFRAMQSRKSRESAKK
jgi:hypothetical protein